MSTGFEREYTGEKPAQAIEGKKKSVETRCRRVRARTTRRNQHGYGRFLTRSRIFLEYYFFLLLQFYSACDIHRTHAHGYADIHTDRRIDVRTNGRTDGRTGTHKSVPTHTHYGGNGDKKRSVAVVASSPPPSRRCMREKERNQQQQRRRLVAVGIHTRAFSPPSAGPQTVAETTTAAPSTGQRRTPIITDSCCTHRRAGRGERGACYPYHRRRKAAYDVAAKRRASGTRRLTRR